MHNRFDQRGQGVACGNGWIPRSKKCSRDKAAQTSKEAKAKTVEKAKARGELKRAVKAGKGQKARDVGYQEKQERRGQMTLPLGATSQSVNPEKTAKGTSKPKPQIADDASIASMGINEFLEGRDPSSPVGQALVKTHRKAVRRHQKSTVADYEAKAGRIPTEDEVLAGIEGLGIGSGGVDFSRIAEQPVLVERTRPKGRGKSYAVGSYDRDGKLQTDPTTAAGSPTEAKYNYLNTMDLLPGQKNAYNRTDSYIQGYLEVMSWHFDRKGEGVACGRGWISRRKKCGRDKSRTTTPEAKARTVEKQKVRQQLRGQVKAAKGQKPYVKPKPEPDTPQGMPHKNPKTPQEFIENGRAVAGAFLANAKKLDSDIASQQQDVAEAEKRVIRQRQEAWSTNIRKVADEIADNPDYQREQERLQQTRDLQDTIEQRYSEGSLSKKEFDSLSDTYRGMRSESAQVLSDMRKAKLDELIQNDPDLKFFSESLARKQQKLTTLAAPAVEFKQQLISTSAMSRSDAEARAKKVKKPPKAKDPGLSDQIADFNQLTNGVPTTLNRITITQQRAHATRDGLARYYGPGQDRRALWHEMAHHLEFADPSIAKVAEEWVKSRATGPQESLNKLTGSNRFDRSEKAYPDHFADPYVGKVYRSGITEVLSMGVEAFSSPERMIQLAAKDPDHFALVLGLLRKP
jgi:hypothetical protein